MPGSARSKNGEQIVRWEGWAPGRAEGGRIDFGDASDEVVILYACNLNGSEAAGQGKIGGIVNAFKFGDIDFAVDVGGHSFEARLPNEIGFFGGAFQHN